MGTMPEVTRGGGGGLLKKKILLWIIDWIKVGAREDCTK